MIDEKTITLTVAEFRKNVKAAFDFALEGGVVIIDRMGQKFHLSYVPRGMGIMHIGIDPAKVNGDISVQHTPPKKNIRLATPTNDTQAAKALGQNPIEAGAYGKAWNEGAKHHLNVPQTTAGEKACCSTRKPCQHWNWNGDSEKWVNNLSGRERGAE